MTPFDKMLGESNDFLKYYLNWKKKLFLLLVLLIKRYFEYYKIKQDERDVLAREGKKPFSFDNWKTECKDVGDDDPAKV